MTVVHDVVAERAARQPHRCFLADARSARSFGFTALHAAVQAWCQEFDAAGVPPAARVLVDIDDPLAFCAVHLAVIAAGRCSAPVDPAAPPAESERVGRALRPWVMVSDRVGTQGIHVDPITVLLANPAARIGSLGPPQAGSG